MPPKRRRSSESSNASSSRSSLSPAPPAPEPASLPVPTVDDDGKVEAASPDAPPSRPNVQHFYHELTGAGRVQGYQPGKGYNMDDVDLVISKLTKNDIQSTKGIENPQSKPLVPSSGKKNERNEGLRIDLQGTIEGGDYERIAIQNNHDHNSHTLSQIHIQVNTKDPIQLGVAKWALRESLTKRCIIKLYEGETTAKAEKRKKSQRYNESPPKQHKMSQASGSKDDAAPRNVSMKKFNETGYNLLSSRKDDKSK